MIFLAIFWKKKSAFLVLPDTKNGFSDSFPFQTVYVYSHHSNSLKVRPTVFQISKIFGSWHFFKGNKFPGHNTNDERRRKRKKKKKRGKRRREEKDLVIQGRAELVLGRLGFGPSWFWAELVLGRLGLGRVGFGPSWLESIITTIYDY